MWSVCVPVAPPGACSSVRGSAAAGIINNSFWVFFLLFSGLICYVQWLQGNPSVGLINLTL